MKILCNTTVACTTAREVGLSTQEEHLICLCEGLLGFYILPSAIIAAQPQFLHELWFLSSSHSTAHCEGGGIRSSCNTTLADFLTTRQD
jgi:hypothetical protein